MEMIRGADGAAKKSAKPPPRRPKAREAAVQEDDEEEDEQTSPEPTSAEEGSESNSEQEQPEDEESQEESSQSSVGAMALVICEDEVQAYATKTGKTPMFLDPAGKAYALADSAATNVTLNIRHLPERLRDEATKVTMILASGAIDAYLLMDEVFAPEVKTPLCPLLRLTKKLDIAIEWTKDHCLLVLQGIPLMRLTVKKGLHYLTEVQFAMIRRALRDQREGLTDVNQLTYWKEFQAWQGRTAKQILAIEPEILAASSKLMTIVQEGKGKNSSKRSTLFRCGFQSDV
eukprot:3729259-Amphidinium_carterae.1